MSERFEYRVNRQLLQRFWNIGLLLVGIGLLIWVLWLVGASDIQANLLAIGPIWFVLLVGLYLLPQIAFFSGWWVLIDSGLRPSGWPRLFGIYLAGNFINHVLPSGSLAAMEADG